MFPASSRLRHSEDIERVLRKGKRLHTPLFDVAILSSTPPRPARVAVIVGKRVSMSAVRRHRIQRQLRHLARGWVSQYPNGYDMVIVARPEAVRGFTAADADITSASESVLKALRHHISL